MNEVKIYREVENETLILDADAREEYNMLAAELGFVTTERAIENKTPIVYPFLNHAMVLQLKAICPVEVVAENYNKSTIPLDILKVLKYCKDNEMFDGYKIWYNDFDPDPMLIGWKWMSEDDKIKGYSFRSNKYLIGRWGDCAMEIPQLLQLGFEKMKLSVIDNATKALASINHIVSNPDSTVREILAGRNVSIVIDGGSSSNGVF